LARTESRGAHQREDFPAPDDTFLKNQILELKDGEIESRWLAPVRVARGSANDG
jgi:succinate dehydrogenase/fumarate reductase flavoprotein subunit